MLYVLWTLLNAFLAAGIIYLLYRVAKYISLRYGLTVFILVLIALGFINSVKAPQATPNKDRTWKFKTTDGIDVFRDLRSVKIYHNPIFSINLGLKLVTDGKNQTEEVSEAWSSLEGLSGNHEWIPTKIEIVKEENAYHYRVTGIVEWNLLGLRAFTEIKTIEGVTSRGPYRP